MNDVCMEYPASAARSVSGPPKAGYPICEAQVILENVADFDMAEWKSVTVYTPRAGGRMVKWLEEISVAPDESQNFYHFHDNRVLPPGVDQEKAKAEGTPTSCPSHFVKLGCQSLCWQ